MKIPKSPSSFSASRLQSSRSSFSLQGGLPDRICRTREDTARKINLTLERLGLVMSVLKETHSGDVIPGTRGLREGAEASLQEILSHLLRLPKEDISTHGYTRGPEEVVAWNWVAAKPANRFLPPGTHAMIQRCIQRLLPAGP